MRTTLPFRCPIIAATVLVLTLRAGAADPPKGFTALFNGKDLSGWHGWAIHAKGAGPYDRHIEWQIGERRAESGDGRGGEISHPAQIVTNLLLPPPLSALLSPL